MSSSPSVAGIFEILKVLTNILVALKVCVKFFETLKVLANNFLLLKKSMHWLGQGSKIAMNEKLGKFKDI